MFGRLSFGLALSRAGATRLSFGFADGALPPGVALSRASAAHYRDASGVWTVAAVDAPRFSYRWNGSAFVMGGLMIEAAATNLVLQSRDLNAAIWTKSGVTASANRLTETAVLGDHRTNQAVSYNSGDSYCLSVEASDVAGSPKRYLVLLLAAAAFGGANRFAKFDLATGTVTYVVGGATAGIEPIGAGRWMCWIASVASATIAASGQLRIDNAAGSSLANYTGDIAAAIDISDVQIEVGTRPTSRIPTTTAPIARAADAVTINWGSRGVSDGTITVRYVFADGSAQQVVTTIASGLSAVPTPLNRSTVGRIEKV
ncbi:phage head spike fiber domain-containing protein [Sphingobium sp. RAC03]|uniref:phage head spike fiber domain-containing protein n=1 Tax=Sphingobium sp. RAC03 TaxID=1843368 RepID=UPI00083E3F73|nr:hypothetical protein [Sphingobium sp. RAC03]AOF95651.1 hypothetical protein BSY17_2624 [Sphingobium sp. RAC03]